MILKAFDADDFNKPFKALICMREVCTEKNPTLFNEWLMKLKKDLPFEKVGFLRLIAKGELYCFFLLKTLGSSLQITNEICNLYL